MKKFISPILVVIISFGLFACKEEAINPMLDEVEVPSEESTEGGTDPDEDGGSKAG